MYTLMCLGLRRGEIAAARRRVRPRVATVLVADQLSCFDDYGGINLLEAAGVHIRYAEIPLNASADELIYHHQGCFAVLAGCHNYTDAVFAGVPDLCVVARLGESFDAVDIRAATRHGVCVTTTPDGLDWAVAMAAESILSVYRHARPAGLLNLEVWGMPWQRLP
jgi:phosphoglycerate dehydrogenase-like enzyme